jgi:hypothetical protein
MKHGKSRNNYRRGDEMKTVKRLKWEKKLTAKEVRHIREWAGGSLRSFAGHAAQLKEDRKITLIEPCWECKMIARKLGLEV